MPILVDSLYGDRRVVVDHNKLTITRTASGAQLGAFLTPLGARQLIDALAPLAAPVPVLPPIDVAEVLNAALDEGQWVVCYRYRGGPYQRSHNAYARGVYTCAEAGRRAANEQCRCRRPDIFTYSARRLDAGE